MNLSENYDSPRITFLPLSVEVVRLLPCDVTAQGSRHGEGPAPSVGRAGQFAVYPLGKFFAAMLRIHLVDNTVKTVSFRSNLSRDLRLVQVFLVLSLLAISSNPGELVFHRSDRSLGHSSNCVAFRALREIQCSMTRLISRKFENPMRNVVRYCPLSQRTPR